MSTGDPDLDAVLAESPTAAAPAPVKGSTGDPDLDAVLSEGAQKSSKTAAVSPYDARGFDVHPVPGTMDVLADRLIGGTVRGIVGGWKGIGELAQGHGATAAEQAVKSVTDQSIQPETKGGKAASAILGSPYNPLNYVDESGEWLGNKSAEMGLPPAVSTAARIAPDAAASLLGFRRGNAAEPSTMAEPEAVQGTPHPLAGVADAESQRLTQARQAGVEAGLELPDRVPPPQVRASNNMVADELNLPKDAPITPKVLDGAREAFGAPAYQAVSKVPKVLLGDAYEDAIGKVDLSKIDEAYRPPETGGSITGERAVELSRYLRNQANKYYKAAKGNPEYEATADAHWDAAEAVEDAVQRRLKATGQGQLATDWDDARTYIAKTYSVQNALDGAGNVVVPALKRQLLKNKPLSGNLETLATLGAMYPDAFKNAPMAPKPSVASKAAAAALPHIATVGGGAAGSIFGPWGAAAGAGGGRLLGEKLAERISQP